jgi:2-haloacid dehalogenase
VAAVRAKQLQHSWLASLMGAYQDFRRLTRLAVEHTFEAHGYDGDVDRTMEAMLRISLFPEARGALGRMAAGARLAILSNGDASSLEALLGNAGIREQFEWVVSADEVRVYKPAPAVYQRLLTRTGSDPGRLLFVSSNSWDAQGASTFGLRTAWVNRRGSPRERIGADPEFEVADLEQLSQLVSG